MLYGVLMSSTIRRPWRDFDYNLACGTPYVNVLEPAYVTTVLPLYLSSGLCTVLPLSLKETYCECDKVTKQNVSWEAV